MSKTRNVIVVGGGSVGIATARAIAAKLDTSRYHLIVITERPFFLHLPGLIRTVVTPEGNLEKQILMSYEGSLNGKGEVKTGSVVSFTEAAEGGGEVVLASGETLPYAALVLTPGAKWEGALGVPGTIDEAQAHFDSWRAKIAKADSIVLVGGGAVGIEFAGEIKDFFPTKTVTLLHAFDALLNDAYPDKYRRRLLQRVNKTGTQVVLGEFLDATEPSEDGTISTRSGKKFKADLVIPTRGGRPNTAVIGTSLGADALTETGHVKVLPTLQLPGHTTIFAGGDVIDWAEQKQATKAAAHAGVIAKNVLSVLNGNKASAVYKGSPELIITTVGRTGGAAYFGLLWGFVLGDWASAMLKSKGLLIDMIRNANGLSKI